MLVRPLNKLKRLMKYTLQANRLQQSYIFLLQSSSANATYPIVG